MPSPLRGAWRRLVSASGTRDFALLLNVKSVATLAEDAFARLDEWLPTNRYRYASCNLRFDVRRSTESEAEFRARINAEARSDEEDGTGTDSDSSEWLLGTKLRHRGSLHSDIWLGTGAELAQKNHLAVFPLNGWWRLRKHLAQYNRRMRYALVVSIRTPARGIDLYTPIEAEIRTLVPIPTS